jgi:thioesterase domain-containing protein
MARIRESFGQILPLMLLFQAPDVEQLAQRLRSFERPEQRSPLVLIQAGGQAPPLFMVHPIGGQVLCYYELARHLGKEQTVYGLEATVRDDTAGSSSTIQQMAARYVEAIQEVQPEGPYFLGGWSIGGLVAFEMAQCLKAGGHDVELLAILDIAAPHQIEHDHEAATASSLSSIARVFEVYAGQQLSISESELSRLGREEQLDFVLAEMKAKDLAPPDVDGSYLRQFLQVAESNLRAKWNYVPAPYSGRITLLRAQDSMDGFEGDHDGQMELGISLGWQDVSTEPVAVHFMPGNHISMLSRANVQVLADVLGQSVGQVQSV